MKRDSVVQEGSGGTLPLERASGGWGRPWKGPLGMPQPPGPETGPQAFLTRRLPPPALDLPGSVPPGTFQSVQAA